MHCLRRSALQLWLCFALVACGSEEPSEPARGEPVLTVDGVPVPRAPGDSRSDEELVEDHLVEREAAAAGLTVDDAEVSVAVESEIREVVAARFRGDPSAWEADLARRGLNAEGWRATRRREVRFDRLARALMARRVEAAELEALFTRRHGEGGVRLRVRQILVSTQVEATRFYSREEYFQERDAVDAEARTLATELRARVVEGTDFAALARERSDDESAARGGALGALWAGRYGAAFDEAVARLSPGELSPVVETPHGHHVIRVDGIRRGARYTGQQILVSARQRGRDDADLEARFTRALERARALRATLAGGRPFEEVARAESDDPATRARGGDLGTFNPGRLGAEVDPVLETLPLGVVSEPIRVPAGYVIVRLQAREFVPADDRKLVSHIVVATNYERVKRRRLGGKLEGLAERRATELLKRARQADADFAALAREYSEDELTRRNGGEYPGYRAGALGPEIDAALNEMQPGEVRLVRSKRGFHLLQLVEVTRVQLEQVRPALEAELRARPPSAGEVLRFRERLRLAARVERRA